MNANHLSVLQNRITPLFHRDEVKRYLRIDFNDDDIIIDSFITAATNHVEQHLGRTLIKTRYQLHWHYCPQKECLDYHSVFLPMGPIISLDKVFDDHRKENIKRISYNLSPPKPYVMFKQGHEHVVIDYTAGFGETPEAVPSEIRQAALVIVAELYRNRDLGNPLQIKDFIQGLLYRHIPKTLG